MRLLPKRGITMKCKGLFYRSRPIDGQTPDSVLFHRYHDLRKKRGTVRLANLMLEMEKRGLLACVLISAGMEAMK